MHLIVQNSKHKIYVVSVV